MDDDNLDIKSDTEDSGNDDERWFGVPSAGERPHPLKNRLLLEITAVLAVEFILWGLYRYFTAPLYGEGFNLRFFIGHIIAAPTIHLGPILIYWRFIRKERLFCRTDYENGKPMSFNFGPFKLTKKRLLSAVLVGLIGGIVWRVAEMLVFNMSRVVMGGTEFMSLRLFDVFTGGDVGIFFLMTFVMFFIVGPVEEFEFRSFVHDQSQKVLPMWVALVFSSIFFGLSHVPIALFIYKMPLMDLIFAEISWMTAGAVFGALYMWSRNIFACIVMHGIGNWQLSVFFFQGRTTEAGLSHTQELIASLIVSIFANALLIFIFYLIHKYYWDPQRRGKAVFKGKLLSLQRFFYRHDYGQKSVQKTTIYLSIITVAVLGMIVSATVGFGVLISERDKGSVEVLNLSVYHEKIENNLDSRYLEENQEFTYSFDSTGEKIIKWINVTLTWEDENQKPGRPTIRQFTNQPDTFYIDLTGPNITVEQEASNQVDSSGIIELSLEVTDEIIFVCGGEFIMNSSIVMKEAGIWTGFAIFGFRDDGNQYDVSYKITYLVKSETDNE